MSYRPNAAWWGMGLLAVAWIVFGLDRLLGWGLLGDPHPDGGGLGAVAIGILFLAFLLAGWRVLEVTEEGLEVRGPGGRHFASWPALGGVGTRQLKRKILKGSIEGYEPITDPQAFMHDIRLADGRVFTRIGPWIARRRELVREIRRRIREVRPGRP